MRILSDSLSRFSKYNLFTIANIQSRIKNPAIAFTGISILAIPAMGPSQSAVEPVGTTTVQEQVEDLISGARNRSSVLDEKAAELPGIDTNEAFGLEGEPVFLTVRDVVAATLGQNLSIAVVEKDREIAGERIWEEFGVYDPVLDLSVTTSRTDIQTGQFGPNGNQIPAYSDNTTAEASITQRTPLGTVMQLFVSDSRTRNRTAFNSSVNGLSFVNPSYNATVGVAVTQPLLRNAGPLVNNFGIRVTRIQLDQTNEAFRAEVINRLSDVIRAYWELDFAIRNADVQRQAIVSAKELERVNNIRVEVGTLPRLALFQAQAQVAERESLLASAEAAIITAQDTLLELMNWNEDDRFRQWNRPIIPTDKPISFLNAQLDDETLTGTALDFRPDFQAAEMQIEIADLNQRVTKRQMLPELNLEGRFSVTGLEDQRGEAFDTARTSDFSNWNYGATLSYPLFNRTARGQFRQAEDQLYQSEVELEELELAIFRQVRSATRNVRTALRQIEATTRQVKADIEALDAETKRRQVGERTTFDVLDFQDNLAASRANQARAFADYQQSLVDLAQAMGITLDVQGIEIADLQGPSGWSYGYNDNPEEPAINTSEMVDWNEIIEIVPRRETELMEQNKNN